MLLRTADWKCKLNYLLSLSIFFNVANAKELKVNFEIHLRKRNKWIYATKRENCEEKRKKETEIFWKRSKKETNCARKCPHRYDLVVRYKNFKLFFSSTYGFSRTSNQQRKRLYSRVWGFRWVQPSVVFWRYQLHAAVIKLDVGRSLSYIRIYE